MEPQSWQDLFRNRQTNVEQAILNIKSSQKVFLAPFCNEPQKLIQELVRQKERLQDVILYNAVIGSPCIYADSSCYPYFQIRTFLSSPLLKGAFLHNTCDYLPVNLSEIPKWLTSQKIDVALIQVTPPNEEGYCNLGLSVDTVQTLIKSAGFVVAQVNRNLPFTNGDTLVHVSEIDQFVLSDTPLLTLSGGNLSEEEITIGGNVAELIPDYATIQVGLGKIAESILLSLKNKKGLGIHSGSISDPIIELINLGVVTNEQKEINRYKTVCTTLTGTEDLYRYCHNNPTIELYPSDYTHNAAEISKISNFYSINSALEVDLFGQINAEQIGKVPVAGVGGQMDFIQGARLSKGGKSIIALPSTAKRGTESRIKVRTSYVTSVKSEIDYVVTEFGFASLFGKSLQERAKELISIAHPQFREKLLAEFEREFMKKDIN
ncbi:MULTISPECIES: acetyl-CoA hydrolase/transferase family protein [Neobacillus]|uniref:Acetyl-CoA hydrolase/transferase family protein n=1 Tax=Neobacillus rhizophilus TaxID=2833579 RepID=A0A942U2Q4_9BACI|nr:MULTISPECIES: acetyl-CoA hydrolase/transferase C-terminal domain-containing protein [Neobacillus]MBS4211413.1 acetyl-CoA hydrolase/transferase family protein [Neobacillus rhizophilus]MBU8916831.1 acetyl-CoA hydrolase [Bacillus sp. FJAT-29953]